MALWLCLLLTMPFTQENRHLIVEGDLVRFTGPSKDRAIGRVSIVLEEAQSIVGVQVDRLELAAHDVFDLPRKAIPKAELWTFLQRLLVAEGYGLVGLGEETPPKRFRLVTPETFASESGSFRLKVPVVSAAELLHRTSPWRDRPAEIILVAVPAGALQASDLIGPESLTSTRPFVRAMPWEGENGVKILAPVSSAISLTETIEVIGRPEGQFRRFDLEVLSAEAAHDLVSKYLIARRPPSDEARPRREVVLRIADRPALVVRADEWLLDEVEELLQLADQ
ncbi:MAG: hypothetical protein RL885_27420 [Planctomycetota bacterium]